MRSISLVACLLSLVGTVYSQPNKILVSPNQEVIPISEQRTLDVIKKYKRDRQPQYTSPRCYEQPIYGFQPEFYVPNLKFGFYHKDACGEWFVMPADGTLDTLYFLTGDQVGPSPLQWPGTMDSTVIFRILESNITPTQGPGVRPGPYHPPCASWGYFVSTNDPESGIAPFVEDATPPDSTSWVPTNLPPSGRDSVPSYPPFGSPLWGLSGYPVEHIRPRSTVRIVMNDLAPLVVHKGEVIFITFRIPSTVALDDSTQDTRFEILGSDEHQPYPARDWKFYEHDSELSNCAGIDRDSTRRGWTARGSLTGDTLAGASYDIWFSFTPTSNTPPRIAWVSAVHNTLSTDPQRIECVIFDCDVQDTAEAGVKNAWVEYTLDSATSNSTWAKASLTYDGGDNFEYMLPGVQPQTRVFYKIVAEDSTGESDSSDVYSYQVVDLESRGWYRIDTSFACVPAQIHSTGTAIDSSQWFIAPKDFNGPYLPHVGDDGTAGPFPITNGFVYFGDTMHYVWVGVDGAIALSKSATDTIDLNAGGFLTDKWDFPYPQHLSRSDTLHENNMPKAFIAPYWADWITKNDSPVATYGKVRHFDDADKSVVEWDSLGEFGPYSSGPADDIAVFRVVLNKTDYSIEFQYDNVGIGGLDTTDLVGIQCDSNYHPQPPGQFPPYAYYNRNGYPSETHLRNGLCIRYIPVLLTCCYSDGWNLVSVPGFYQGNDKAFLYPTSVGPAFTYNSGYTTTSFLENGVGFWLKFFGPQCIDAIGKRVTDSCIHVTRGWNIVGALSSPVPLSSLSSTCDSGGGISPAPVAYTYSGISGYQVATTLLPCFGYFIRSSCDGCIAVPTPPGSKVANHELDSFDKITIAEKTGASQTLFIGSGTFDPDRYQMPPSPPDAALDIRFASNRLVELYPDTWEPNRKYAYTITLNATHYPLTVRYEHPDKNDDQMTLTLKTDDGKFLALMNGGEKITINDARIKRLLLEVNQGVAVPRHFALGRNYPNPFNPVTRFTVEIPRTSRVQVFVYDILGRKIATLFNGEETAGYHTMEWEGRNDDGIMVSTGIYFIRMDVPSEKFSDTKKIMLMK